MAKQERTPATVPGAAAVIVQQGKILDYIDELTQRKETPEEYARQEIAKFLVREYRYQKDEIGVEFGLRLGLRRPRVDLVTFGKDDPHVQDRARIIIECKSEKTKATARKDGVGQLHSYMSACPNVSTGRRLRKSVKHIRYPPAVFPVSPSHHIGFLTPKGSAHMHAHPIRIP